VTINPDDADLHKPTEEIMTSQQVGALAGIQVASAATSNRVPRSFAVRIETAGHDAFIPAPAQIDNGDEALYSDKSGTYTKGILQAGVGLVDLAAYQTFKTALNSGDPADFEAITLAGPRTLTGPQGGLAFDLECLDNSQFSAPPAPALASEGYATELVEMYWASLLRDVAFTDYPANSVAVQAANELSSMASYKGPRDASNKVTPGLLFRGGFPGETIGPYISQFIIQNTSMGALPINRRPTRWPRPASGSSIRMIGRLRDRPRGRCDALAPHAETHEAGGQAAQDRKSDEEPQEPRRRGLAGAAEDTRNHVLLNDDLDALNDLRWPFAPLLHLRQKLIAQRPLASQRPGENIGGGDRVLNGEVDADATDRRHRMRGVADAQKPRLVPKRQPVDRDGQELHVIKTFEFVNAIGEKRSQRGNMVAQGV
jgi:hypothetical protein